MQIYTRRVRSGFSWAKAKSLSVTKKIGRIRVVAPHRDLSVPADIYQRSEVWLQLDS